MGTVQGRLDLRYHQGAVQSTTDGGLNWSPVGSASWYDTEETFLRNAVPTLTAFDRLKIGNAQSGNITLPAGYTDGGTVGGSLKTNSSAPVPVQTGSAFQTLKTVPWAISIRAKFAAQGAGDSSMVGFGNGSSFTMFGMNNATDAAKFVFFTADGVGQTNVASSLNSDTNWHTVRMTFDPAASTPTITVYVDGVSVFTTTTTTRLPTVAMFVAAYGINGGGGGGVTFISRAVYGYIDP